MGRVTNLKQSAKPRFFTRFHKDQSLGSNGSATVTQSCSGYLSNSGLLRLRKGTTNAIQMKINEKPCMSPFDNYNGGNLPSVFVNRQSSGSKWHVVVGSTGLFEPNANGLLKYVCLI